MGRGIRGIGVVAVVLAAMCLPGMAAARPHNPFQRTIGTYLGTSAGGVCPVAAHATRRRCTIAQSDKRIESAIGYGKYPHVPGHIVRFRLTSGTATPGTVAVLVRFRALDGPRGAGGPASRWFNLPLHHPGVHEYPVDVPFAPGDRIAVDVSVRGNGRGEAAAPLAEASKPRWGIAEWTPPLGPTKRPPRIRPGVSINLNAVFERDDQTPPILHYTYAPRQDFLHTGRVYVRVRSNERVLLNPETALLTEHVTWGLLHNIPHLRPRRWLWFVCELEPPAIRNAEKAIRQGRHPRVAIRLIAWDRARNKATTRSLYVMPLRG